MILMNEDSVIQGNTVLKPQYDPSTYREENEEKLKSKKPKKGKKFSVKHKIKTVRNIGIAFVVGLILVGRYSVIYDMQKQLNVIKTNINEVNKENENLKVELVKYNNLHYIEETATSKLKMIPPDKNSAIYVELNKKTLKSVEEKKQEETEKNIWHKLRKILF